MSKNNITGDEVKSRALSDKGRRNYEIIFSRKTVEEWAVFLNLNKTDLPNLQGEVNFSQLNVDLNKDF